MSQYLDKRTDPADRILVIEEGEDFFETSEITHQRNWTRSYSEGSIFKLHNAQTPEGIPILSGYASTMGGGGSINYTMIFESPKWLADHFGHGERYWNRCIDELSAKFQRKSPVHELTPVGNHLLDSLESCGFQLNRQRSENIPIYKESRDKQIHVFPNQFNEFGQRTHSGVSLVKWHNNPRLQVMTKCRVTRLDLETLNDREQRCCRIIYQDLKAKEERSISLDRHTRVLLCAGAATPQLLYPHREALRNFEIGEHVNDHIVLPFGIYLLSEHLQPTLKDQYISLFATEELPHSEDPDAEKTVCNYDFFSGSLDDLLYLISHLFLAFWVPNGIKLAMIQQPRVFQALKWLSRRLVQFLNSLDDVLYSLKHPSRIGKHEWSLISAIVKFNISLPGYYQRLNDRDPTDQPLSSFYEIILRCFQENSDRENVDRAIAKSAISKQIELMSKLGKEPHPVFRYLIRLLTRMPYRKEQVDQYLDHYQWYDLLTEQHLSGGCVFGKAIDLGLEASSSTGKVFGSQNLYVGDLSASPLPRVSPQMTAYLIGHHLANQLY